MKSTQPPTSTADAPLSMTVVECVADAEDVDPVALEPLYEAIDPDLLDSLPDAAGFSSLEFDYQGYTVAVTAANEGMTVTLADTDSSAAGSRS